MLCNRAEKGHTIILFSCLQLNDDEEIRSRVGVKVLIVNEYKSTASQSTRFSAKFSVKYASR